jgi:hypothetical protein
LLLAGTPISDESLAYLAEAKSLQSLCLRDTAITDRGLMLLSHLPKLCMAEGAVEGTAISTGALDAFFQAQQESVRRMTRSTLTSLRDAASWENDQDTSAAISKLNEFMGAMNEWWRADLLWVEEFRKPDRDLARQQSLFATSEELLRTVFERFCTDPAKCVAVRHGGSDSYYNVGEYRIIEVDKLSRSKLNITVDNLESGLGADLRFRFRMRRVDSSWLVERKDEWRSGWKSGRKGYRIF